MKILRLALIYYKRLIKDTNNLMVMLLMPLVVIFGVYYITTDKVSMTNIDVAFSIEDRGEYSEEMLSKLKLSKAVFYNERSKAMELLEKNDVIAVYVIPDYFTEDIKAGKKPEIQSYKKDDGNATLPVEISINDYVNKKVKEQLLLKHGIISDKDQLYDLTAKTNIEAYKKKMGSELSLALLMIIYFIILSSNNLGTELLNLKQQKILSRALTTANKGYEIVGSIFLAMFFLQVSINLLVLILGKYLIGYALVDMDIIIANIALASMISISLGLFVTRIFKNPGVASMVLTILSVVSIMLSSLALSGDGIRKMPWILHNLAKFTPQYWLLDSIEKASLFPNSLVLLLMTLALFTAGNYKLRDYVNR